MKNEGFTPQIWVMTSKNEGFGFSWCFIGRDRLEMLKTSSKEHKSWDFPLQGGVFDLIVASGVKQPLYISQNKWVCLGRKKPYVIGVISPHLQLVGDHLVPTSSGFWVRLVCVGS